MKLRHTMLALLAVAGLTFGGCGKADSPPPPGAVTDTPDLVIDDGSQVSPDEVGTEKDADKTKSEDPGDAGGDDSSGQDGQ